MDERIEVVERYEYKGKAYKSMEEAEVQIMNDDLWNVCADSDKWLDSVNNFIHELASNKEFRDSIVAILSR